MGSWSIRRLCAWFVRSTNLALPAKPSPLSDKASPEEHDAIGAQAFNDTIVADKQQ